MTKIALSILALAALSTASFADRNREDFRFNGNATDEVFVESAPVAVYGSGNYSAINDDADGGRQGGGR